MHQNQIAGPDTLPLLLAGAAQTKKRVFILGSTEEVVKRFVARAEREHPGIEMCGYECPPFRPATEEEKLILGVPADKEYTVYDPVGCPLCGDTGYYGRTGVYEIMNISPKLKHVISSKGSTEQIKAAALEEGMHTLRMSAAEYVLDGTTTISEMVRISFEQ